jgi:hypothetical protein
MAIPASTIFCSAKQTLKVAAYFVANYSKAAELYVSNTVQTISTGSQTLSSTRVVTYPINIIATPQDEQDMFTELHKYFKTTNRDTLANSLLIPSVSIDELREPFRSPIEVPDGAPRMYGMLEQVFTLLRATPIVITRIKNYINTINMLQSTLDIIKINDKILNKNWRNLVEPDKILSAFYVPTDEAKTISMVLSKDFTLRFLCNLISGQTQPRLTHVINSIIVATKHMRQNENIKIYGHIIEPLRYTITRYVYPECFIINGTHDIWALIVAVISNKYKRYKVIHFIPMHYNDSHYRELFMKLNCIVSTVEDPELNNYDELNSMKKVIDLITSEY